MYSVRGQTEVERNRSESAFVVKRNFKEGFGVFRAGSAVSAAFPPPASFTCNQNTQNCEETPAVRAVSSQ